MKNKQIIRFLVSSNSRAQKLGMEMLEKEITKSLKQCIRQYGGPAKNANFSQSFDELFNEVAFVLWRYIKEDKGEVKNLKDWCFGVAKNLLLQNLRTTRDGILNDYPSDLSIEPIIEAIEVAQQEKAKITSYQQALRNLCETCRAILISKYTIKESNGKRKTWAEVAKELKYTGSISSLRKKGYDCRKKVQQPLKK